jgi:hypothetical protein
VGDSWGISEELGNLGVVVAQQGDAARAVALLEGALALCRREGSREAVGSTLNRLGMVAARQGEYVRAATMQREALVLSRDPGLRSLVHDCLEGLAQVGAGQVLRAARLGGAAEAVRQALGTPLPPNEQVDHAALVATARTASGAEAYTTAWAEGGAAAGGSYLTGAGGH